MAGNAGEGPDRAIVPTRAGAIALSAFAGISAVAGGLALIVWRHGNGFVPIDLLDSTSFATFLIPGILLTLVVGGTNVVAAVAAWRGTRLTVDLLLLAGASLTIWIVVECALLETVVWLHLVYGAIGLALLTIGLAAAHRSGLARHRWTITVTIAESLGYLAPALAGLWTARLPGSGEPIAAAVVAAGFVEGLVLGVGQALAFSVRVHVWRYAGLTALGAGAVWAAVMTMMAIGGSASVGVQIAVGVAAGVVGLVGIGGAQWLELRRHVPRAWTWIGWTAAAWILALPMSFLPGPLVDESTPLVTHLIVWPAGGLVMAYVMALVTWQGVRRLTLPATRPPQSAR